MPRESEEDWTNIRLRLAAVPQALDRLRASFMYAAADGKVAARRQAVACADSVRGVGRDRRGVLRARQGMHGRSILPRKRSWRPTPSWSTATGCGTTTPPSPVRRTPWDPSATGCSPATTTAPTSTWPKPTPGDGTSCTAFDIESTNWSRAIAPGASLVECTAALKMRPPLRGGRCRPVRRLEPGCDRSHDRRPERPLLRHRRTTASMPIDADPRRRPCSTTYYTPPSEDFSRPGQIWHPVAGKTHFPLWDALVIAYHESTPGHHLQLAQTMYQAESLTRFQRLGVFISGHGEGWALYAERLMHELGYLDDPVFELGFLVGAGAARRASDPRHRAALRDAHPRRRALPPRRGVETGARPAVPARTNRLPRRVLVIRGRSLPRARRAKRSPTRSANVCGSKAGQQAERRLGESFDLKEFHRVVLDWGGMGLDQLRNELALFGAGAADQS